jgi:hypothetical protein
VRTPSFKKWFGDWEIEAVADWALNSRPVVEMTGNEFAKSSTKLDKQVAEYFSSIGGKVAWKGYGEVILNERGAKDSIAHGLGREKAIAFYAVPEVIKQGQIADRQENWKGRGYDTYVIIAPVKIENQEYIEEVVVIEQSKGKKNTFYLHEVEIKTKLQRAFKTGSDTSAPGASKLIIAQKLEEVKGKVSQVRDANGEPLAVYHGTDADFDVLDREKQGVTRDYIKRCFYRLLPGSR